MPHHHPRIALLLNLQIGYCRRAIMGIAAYGRERGWLLEELPSHVDSMISVNDEPPDGVIAHVLDEPLGRMLENSGLPVVNLSSNHEDLSLSSIDADQTVVGEMAAHHFCELGYRHFAFFGSSSAAFSRQREEAFKNALASMEVSFDAIHIDYTLRPPFERHIHQAEEAVSRWLNSLPKPTAIFCSNDEHARLLSSLCKVGGIVVPDEVALLGVDNDETMCFLSIPPLSSVDNPGEAIGYRAAVMLDHMITSPDCEPRRERIPPIQIIERASTGRFAAEDPLTRKAMSFIEKNLRNTELSVDVIADHLDLSRRSLERRFARKLGITVLAATQRARIRKAKTLLRESTLSIQVIASECGFSNHRRLGIVFQSMMEMTPTEFRNFYDVDKLQ